MHIPLLYDKWLIRLFLRHVLVNSANDRVIIVTEYDVIGGIVQADF